MAQALNSFQKKKDFLVCVDSDGCAMDTMDIKHINCFGPCMVDEWELDAWRQPILTRWNDINLYTMTRGINRFKGLAMALGEINGQYCPVPGIEALQNWAENAPELSNNAVQARIDAGEDPIFEKALRWSKAVNASIQKLAEEDKKPFPGVLEALTLAQEHADVAIVSSANRDAVLAEWELHGLLPHTDIVLAQDSGSKAYCIGELKKKGYAPGHILMCGDAPGDLDAAKKNDVFYFPILVKREGESWAEFSREGLGRLLDGSFGGEYQRNLIRKFLNNLGQEA